MHIYSSDKITHNNHLIILLYHLHKSDAVVSHVLCQDVEQIPSVYEAWLQFTCYTHFHIVATVLTASTIRYDSFLLANFDMRMQNHRALM